MKYLLISFLLCSQLSLALIFSNNPHLAKNNVSGQWIDGSIVLTDGTTIEGQVRDHSYKAHDVRSFRFRDEKGAKAFTYGADECMQVVQNGLIIFSPPKNLKKIRRQKTVLRRPLPWRKVFGASGSQSLLCSRRGRGRFGF